MKGLAITSKGLEETASMEIKELIGKKCENRDGCVIFDFNKFEELCLLCYKAQSVDRILYLIGNAEFKEIGDFEKFFEKIDFGEWLKKHKKFKVECLRVGSHDFKSIDAEKRLINFINKKYKNAKFGLRAREYFLYFYSKKRNPHIDCVFAG